MQKKGRLATFLAIVAVLALFVTACSKKEDTVDAGGSGTTAPTADASASGTVAASGSSTVEPLSSAVAEAFSADNDKVEISVDGPGTGDGFKLFCNDETDISDASRPIKAEEVTACEAKGVEFIELKVAIDGLSVIVNPENPLECLNFADLYALTGSEAQDFDNWTDAQPLATELGSSTEFPDLPLDITAPGEESGTYDSFVEIALKSIAEDRIEAGKAEEGSEAVTRPDYQSSGDDNTIVQGVEGSEGGLGWVGFAFADQAGDAIKMMPIAKAPGDECVAPSQDTIGDGSYPLSRYLYIYVNAAKAESNPAVVAYVDFYLAGLTGFVEQVDYVNLTEADITATKTVWDARTTGTRDGGE